MSQPQEDNANYRKSRTSIKANSQLTTVVDSNNEVDITNVDHISSEDDTSIEGHMEDKKDLTCSVQQIGSFVALSKEVGGSSNQTHTSTEMTVPTQARKKRSLSRKSSKSLAPNKESEKDVENNDNYAEDKLNSEKDEEKTYGDPDAYIDHVSETSQGTVADNYDDKLLEKCSNIESDNSSKARNPGLLNDSHPQTQFQSQNQPAKIENAIDKTSNIQHEEMLESNVESVTGVPKKTLKQNVVLHIVNETIKRTAEALTPS